MRRAAPAHRAGRPSPARLPPGRALLRLLALVAAAVAASARSRATRARADATATRGSSSSRPAATAPTSSATPSWRRCARPACSGQVISPDMREDRVGTLSLLAQQGYDLVIVDFSNVDALEVVAPRFPKTHFALFDAPLDDLRGHPRNVEAIVHRAERGRVPRGLARRPARAEAPGKGRRRCRGGIEDPIGPGVRRRVPRRSPRRRSGHHGAARTTPTISPTQTSAKPSRGARSRAAQAPCSTWRARAASERCRPRRPTARGESAWTPTSRASARTS